MASLYEELGADPSADQEQLRRAYRQRARELHPDINGGVDAGPAMQRLNAVWAVLGDPDARARYNEQLQDQVRPAPAPPRPAPVVPAPRPQEEPDSLSSAIGCFLRPSVVIPAVLLLIFVFTAYAGHLGSGGTTPAPAVPTTTGAQPANPGSSPSATTAPTTGTTSTTDLPAAALVGSCIQDQGESVVIVPCSQRPNSLVIATIPNTGQCPAGTTGYLVPNQTEMVCAAPQGP